MKKCLSLLILLVFAPFVAWSLIAAYLSFTEVVNNQWFEENGLVWIGEATEVIEDTQNNIVATRFNVMEVWCGTVETTQENPPAYMEQYFNSPSQIWLITQTNTSNDQGYPLNEPILIASVWTDYRYTTGQYAEDWLPIDQSSDSVTGYIHFDPLIETMTLDDLEAELSLEHCATSSGISNNFSLSTDLFPNPVENIVQVAFASDRETDLAIYDATGTLVLEVKDTIESATLDLSNFPTGMYFLAFSQNGLLIGNEKFMKK